MNEYELELPTVVQENKQFGCNTICGFEGIFLHTAQWLSWLERRPVTAKVVGSSPIWVVKGLFNPCGVLAQLGEHLPYKQRVIGSSPIGPIYRENGFYLCSTPMWLNSRQLRSEASQL